MSVLFGQQVVFDHYRPWGDQIPPLQPIIYRLFCHPRFLVNICHSDYTRRKYLDLGVPAVKLHRVHNGFDPARFEAPIPTATAKQALGIAPAQKTVMYAGRINAKKGLELLIEAAKRLPDILFILVGSYGNGPIETLAQTVPNVRFIPWQPPEPAGRLCLRCRCADHSAVPAAACLIRLYGVAAENCFFYMGSGRPILGRGYAGCRGGPAKRP